MKLWKINCEEDKYPGLWQRWFKNQCAAVGWPPGNGWRLYGGGEQRAGWTAARKALQEIEPGDYVVVQLSHHDQTSCSSTEKRIPSCWNASSPNRQCATCNSCGPTCGTFSAR